MRFTKMQGAGKRLRVRRLLRRIHARAACRVGRQVSDRHFGIGGDGLILICPSNVADARMRMFNADGSESEMCGNGVRCVAKYVYDHGHCRKETLADRDRPGCPDARLGDRRRPRRASTRGQWASLFLARRSFLSSSPVRTTAIGFLDFPG